MDFALLILIATVLISTTASSVGDLVFVQTGSSVQLDIQQENQFIKLIWLNDKSEHLVRFSKETKNVKLHTSYMERIGFNTETFTLTLRNVQRTDSGIYRARATGEQENYVADHNVLVLDPVVTPLLTLLNSTMISVNSCIVDVTCIGHDLTLSSSYYSNCSEEEVTPLKKHNIDMISEVIAFLSLQWLTVFIVSVTLLLLAGAAVLYCSYRKYKKGTQQSESTIYAEVEPENKVQRDLEMSERSQNPVTVYSSQTLQGHNASNCHIYNEVQERINITKTTYHTVGQQTKKSAPAENNLSVYSLVSK